MHVTYSDDRSHKALGLDLGIYAMASEAKGVDSLAVLKFIFSRSVPFTVKLRNICPIESTTWS
jgi:hypothetical protein